MLTKVGRPSRLLIDDTRSETSPEVNCELDVIARNYWTGIHCLVVKKWDVVYLDHDLHSFDANGKEWTGYDIMTFLEENVIHIPNKIICVSSNPVGRARIQNLIKKLYEGR